MLSSIVYASWCHHLCYRVMVSAGIIRHRHFLNNHKTINSPCMRLFSHTRCIDVDLMLCLVSWTCMLLISTLTNARFIHFIGYITACVGPCRLVRRATFMILVEISRKLSGSDNIYPPCFWTCARGTYTTSNLWPCLFISWEIEHPLGQEGNTIRYIMSIIVYAHIYSLPS